MWGWIAIAAAAGIGVIMWRKTKAPAQSGQSTPIQVVPDDTSGQYESVLAMLRDLQGAESSEPTTPTTTPTPTQDTLPGVTNLKVAIAGPLATATWSPVSGALWYTAFWQTPHGSTGGYKTNLPSSVVNLDMLNVSKGQWVKCMVYPSKGSGPGAGDEVRGPDVTSPQAVRS